MELLIGIVAAAILAGGAGYLAGQMRVRKSLQEAERKLSVVESEMRLISAQHERELQLVQQQLPTQFENLATKILESSSQKLTKESEESLGQLLAPLRERLAEFHKKVEDSFGKEAQERFALKKEIENIVATNERMRLEAENLTNALRGSNKAQGNWGEYILTKLLEDCGLREGAEFTTQGRDLKLKGADGQHLQPDIILNLPEGKHLIVDSKVSLTHYERFVNSTDEAERKQALGAFTTSLRAHVKGLADKDYASAEKVASPDFVFMFLPIEGAHCLALQSDSELFSYAWERRIALVSPTTLMPILRTVASIWRLDKQNRNTQEIARQGGALYDKFVGFLESMEAIGTHLTRSQKAYDEAYNKLKGGKGNLITSSEKLRELGAKASKAIPENVLTEAENSVAPASNVRKLEA